MKTRQTNSEAKRRPILSEVEFVNLPLVEFHSSFSAGALPPIEAFYSKLNISSISSDDYQHAQRVWKEFRILNVGEDHDLYLRTNVVLLANV